jgi:biopolymer transport protein ExbD
MITRPLDLQSKVSPAPRDFDVFFWVAGVVIVLLFALHGSRFIVTPGVAVQIGQDPALELPQASNSVLGRASVVVSYRRDNMILFEGGVYELQTFRPVLEAYAKRNPGTAMLVQMDKQVTMQGWMALKDIAEKAGFVTMIVAIDSPEAAQDGFIEK